MSETHSAAARVFSVGGPAVSQASSRSDVLVIRSSANVSGGIVNNVTFLMVFAPTPINSSKLLSVALRRPKALQRFSRT